MRNALQSHDSTEKHSGLDRWLEQQVEEHWREKWSEGVSAAAGCVCSLCICSINQPTPHIMTQETNVFVLLADLVALHLQSRTHQVRVHWVHSWPVHTVKHWTKPWTQNACANRLSVSKKHSPLLLAGLSTQEVNRTIWGSQYNRLRQGTKMKTGQIRIAHTIIELDMLSLDDRDKLTQKEGKTGTIYSRGGETIRHRCNTLGKDR